MKKLLKISIRATLLCGLASLVSTASAVTYYPATFGRWAAVPGQATNYGAAVQQPINGDGSSNFKANGNVVIPIKFALSQGTGPFVFQSTLPGIPYSILQWQPNPANGPFTFNQLTTLIADYTFTSGDCHTGSLRWDVEVIHNGVSRIVEVYYGNPNADTPPTQSCSGTYSETGKNLMDPLDLTLPVNRFEMQGGWGVPGPLYTTYADAVASTNGGTDVVVGIQLTLDSGYAGSQVVLLTGATVEVGNGATTPYTETFTPLPVSALTPTCPTFQASIRISKVNGTPSGTVNEPQTIQPPDNNGIFRIVDCKYMYNLATNSLSGVGTYTVYATIGSSPEFTVATFDLK